MPNKDHFYKVYSLDINTPPEIEPWLSLLPSLKTIGLKLEDHDWVSNKTKDNTIQLHILNRSFTYTARIEKNQCIGFIVLLGEIFNDVVNTKYTTIC